jgi:hypothetical protein
VSTLCYSCRRTEDRTTQQGLSQFFTAASTSASASAPAPRPPYATQGSNPRLEGAQAGLLLTRLSFALGRPSSGGEALLCSRCRRSMEQKVADRTGASHHAGTSRVLPQIARLRQYQRLAAEQKVPFAIAEHAAAAMMREPCTACGAAAPLGGHGLTRLRVWPEGLARPARGGFMGPYAPTNLAAACSTCNLMKGCRSVRGYVEAARHIATLPLSLPLPLPLPLPLTLTPALTPALPLTLTLALTLALTLTLTLTRRDTSRRTDPTQHRPASTAATRTASGTTPRAAAG